jgi:hypothetical protein
MQTRLQSTHPAAALLVLAAVITSPAWAAGASASAGGNVTVNHPVFATHSYSDNSGPVISAFATADLAAGTLRGSLSQDGPDPVSGGTVRHDIRAGLSDALLIGGSGSGFVDLVMVGTGSASAVTNQASAGYGFTVTASAGFGQGVASLFWDTTSSQPTLVQTDRGTAGNHGAVDAMVNAAADEMRLRVWVNAGDRVSFTGSGLAFTTTAVLADAFATAEFAHTGQMMVEISPGLSWASQSGVFLTSPVPELPPAAMLAAGLAVMSMVAVRRRQH